MAGQAEKTQRNHVIYETKITLFFLCGSNDPEPAEGEWP
jgi:hypothetical protein